MGVSDFKIFMFKKVKIKRRWMQKFLLCINRDIFKMPPQIFLLNYKRLVLDKKVESWSSFSRYSLSPNKNFILFVPVDFTAIHVI